MYHTELHIYMGKTSGIMFDTLVCGAVICYRSCVPTFHFKQCFKKAGM
jgi:hypothetical protein